MELNEINNTLKSFEERVAKERAELEAKVKKELVNYIIERFKKVSYREQCISLSSKYGEYTLCGEPSNGSESPCTHFSVMGMIKVVSDSIEDRRNGRYYTGEKKYYVEKPRRYYQGESDQKHIWRICEDTELSIERLQELAKCLRDYHGRVFSSGSWMNFDCD